MSIVVRELTRADKLEVFRMATSGFKKYNQAQFEIGMTDQELEVALKQSLGIFGGSCGPDCLSVTYQGAELKIWGSWEIINPYELKPLFAGQQTIKMAREVYGIRNNSDMQLGLF
jgi:hypothetical protein